MNWTIVIVALLQVILVLGLAYFKFEGLVLIAMLGGIALVAHVANVTSMGSLQDE